MARMKSEGSNTRTFLERGGDGECQRKSLIESAVNSIEGLVRTLKYALEERIQTELDPHSAASAWLVEHTAEILTKYKVGVDGMTSFQQMQKEYKGEILDWLSCATSHSRQDARRQSSISVAGWSMAWTQARRERTHCGSG